MTDLGHRDVDLIGPPHPGQTRMALTVLAIIAVGSFAAGLGRQVVGPLLAAPQAEDPAHVAIAQAQPLSPTTQPSMQVAATEPVQRAPPKLDVPDPEPATPLAPAPAVAPEAMPAPGTATDAAAPPPADTAAPPAEPPEPPADSAQPPTS